MGFGRWLVIGTAAALASAAYAVTTSENASKAPVSTAGPGPAAAKPASAPVGKAAADTRTADKAPATPPAKK